MAPNEGPGGNRTVWESRPGYSGPAGGGPTGGGGRPPGGGGGGRPPGGGGPPHGPRGYGSDVSLPADYLKDGYFDEGGRIRRDIILGTAESISQTIASDRILGRDRIASSAIRAFFSHVRGLEAQLDGGTSFEDVRLGIWRLVKMAEYQRHRKEPPINETFIDFIGRNVKLAEKDEKHFRAFVEHFESVMAFFPRQERGQR